MSGLFGGSAPPPPPMIVPPPPQPVPRAPDIGSPVSNEAAMNKAAQTTGGGREGSNLTRQRSPGMAAPTAPDYSGKTLG